MCSEGFCLFPPAQCSDGVEHRTGVGGRDWRQEERCSPGRSMDSSAGAEEYKKHLCTFSIGGGGGLGSLSHCKRHQLKGTRPGELMDASPSLIYCSPCPGSLRGAVGHSLCGEELPVCGAGASAQHLQPLLCSVSPGAQGTLPALLVDPQQLPGVSPTAPIPIMVCLAWQLTAPGAGVCSELLPFPTAH